MQAPRRSATVVVRASSDVSPIRAALSQVAINVYKLTGAMAQPGAGAWTHIHACMPFRWPPLPPSLSLSYALSLTLIRPLSAEPLKKPHVLPHAHVRHSMYTCMHACTTALCAGGCCLCLPVVHPHPLPAALTPAPPYPTLPHPLSSRHGLQPTLGLHQEAGRRGRVARGAGGRQPQ